ncbi:MAG: metal ABC transporter permease, partial [Burkholderiales bacterium]
LFVLAATGGTLLLANNPHGAEHLADLLVGQILWVSYSQLVSVSVITAIILAMWFGLRDRWGRTGFYLLFAWAITASVQLVGIYLVFASLIIPALAIRNYAPQRQLGTGYAFGCAAYILGLVGSAILDLPSGPLIVWALALLGLIVYAAGANRAAFK